MAMSSPACNYPAMLGPASNQIQSFSHRADFSGGHMTRGFIISPCFLNDTIANADMQIFTLECKEKSSPVSDDGADQAI